MRGGGGGGALLFSESLRYKVTEQLVEKKRRPTRILGAESNLLVPLNVVKIHFKERVIKSDL